MITASIAVTLAVPTSAIVGTVKPQGINFKDIEDALFAFAKASTGYADAAIIFDSQDLLSPEPTPYVTIRVGDLLNIGIDGTAYSFDANRPTGEEIHRTTQGMRDLIVSFAFFTPAVVGSATARTAAAKMQADLSRQSLRDALNAAGLGVMDPGAVRWVPKINNTTFEGRAVLEVRFAVPQGAVDATGYIALVNATPTINGVQLPVIPIQISD